jgi:hypothetical protein
MTADLNNSWEPNPVDTGSTRLSTELQALVEKIACNVHDVWARTRLEEGWTWGPGRNDKQKTHPCLIPYSDLPESEKEVDRKMAMEVLKLVTMFGYRIEKS